MSQVTYPISTLRPLVYKILDSSEEQVALSRNINGFIMVLIILNVLAVVIQTVQPLYDRYALLFTVFEVFSVAVFSLEYLARLWSAGLNPRYAASHYPWLKYMVSFGGMIDLVAILPFFLPMVGTDLRFIRLLRLFRLVRVMKLGRYSQAVQTMGNILHAKRAELTVAVSIVLMLLLFASTIMFALENQAQPEAFGSIPETMWWGVTTLTTVGYGDVYPITPLGKLFGSLIAIFCLGIFALPAGIIAGGFTDELQAKNLDKGHCPHCGKPTHHSD